jgi:hypothetical protein
LSADKHAGILTELQTKDKGKIKIIHRREPSSFIDNLSVLSPVNANSNAPYEKLMLYLPRSSAAGAYY